jgi:hypothetical protein
VQETASPGSPSRRSLASKAGEPGPRWVIHAPLLAAAFVLDVALTNEVVLAGFLRPLIVAVLFAAALTLIGWAVFRDRWAGSLAATIGLLILASERPMIWVWQTVSASFGTTVAIAAFGVILVGLLAVPAALYLRWRHGNATLHRLTADLLNRFAALLVVVVVVFNVAPDLPDVLAAAPSGAVPQHQSPEGDLPDIYLLLLDGYPRADTLSRRFGIDNSQFLDRLRALGFDVPSGSHSNYVFTQLSLASLFQMRHIDEIEQLQGLIGTAGTHSADFTDVINNNPTFDALRAAGYEIVSAMPGYEHVSVRGGADRVLDHGEMNDLERTILQRTWLLDLIAPLLPAVFSQPQRDRIVHEFDDLERLSDEPRDHPVFAFIHVPAPHLPIAVDEFGDTFVIEPRRFSADRPAGMRLTDAEFRMAYVGELSYLNRRVVEALQSSEARADPVIVILSDHGYTYDLADTPARFANLLAVSTPQEPGLFGEGVTPVNIMPVLLNRYLGTDFERSEDRYFLSSGPREPMRLTEVTDPEAGG